MWDHVTLRASDLAEPARFYDLVLATVGAFVLDPDGNNVELVFHDR
jgi:hypothetical protein